MRKNRCGKSFHLFHRCVSLSLSFLFFFTNSFSPVSLYAGILPQENSGEISALPESISVLGDLPKEIGALKEVHPGKANAPFLIYIQDLHANPSAQRNINEILKYLSPSLIAVEGAAGPLHPEYLNLIPGFPDVNEKIVADLIEKGELTGAELFAWEEYRKFQTRDGTPETGDKSDQKSTVSSLQSPVLVFGVEDPALYRENFKTYRELIFQRDEIEVLLTPLRQKLELAASKIFSKELREFLKERERRKLGDYGTDTPNPQLLPYLKFLSDSAEKDISVNLRDPLEQIRFPSLTRVLTLEKIEMQVNQAAAGREQKTLLKIVGGKARSEKDKQLVADLSKIDTKSDPRRIVEALWEFSINYRIDLKHYPQYLKWLGTVILRAEISGEELFSEIEILEKEILNKLATDPKQKKLLQDLEDFNLLTRLLQLKLTREEFASLRGTGRDFAARTEAISEQRLLRFARNDLKPYYKAALSFYETAVARDKVLLDNTLAVIARPPKAGEAISVLIAGGFHTDGLTAQMKAKGMGYAVIQPATNAPDSDKLLERVFRDENADLSHYFPGRKFTKQEALFLKEILEIGGKDKNLLKTAIKNHPLFAGISAPLIAANTHSIVSPLLIGKNYSILWSPPPSFNSSSASHRSEAGQASHSLASPLGPSQSARAEARNLNQFLEGVKKVQTFEGIDLLTRAVDDPSRLRQAGVAASAETDLEQAFDGDLETIAGLIESLSPKKPLFGTSENTKAVVAIQTRIIQLRTEWQIKISEFISRASDLSLLETAASILRMASSQVSAPIDSQSMTALANAFGVFDAQSAATALITASNLSQGFVQGLLTQQIDTLRTQRAVQDAESLKALTSETLQLAYKISRGEIDSIPGDDAEAFRALQNALGVQNFETVKERLMHPALRDHLLPLQVSTSQHKQNYVERAQAMHVEDQMLAQLKKLTVPQLTLAEQIVTGQIKTITSEQEVDAAALKEALGVESLTQVYEVLKGSEFLKTVLPKLVRVAKMSERFRRSEARKNSEGRKTLDERTTGSASLVPLPSSSRKTTRAEARMDWWEKRHRDNEEREAQLEAALRNYKDSHQISQKDTSQDDYFRKIIRSQMDFPPRIIRGDSFPTPGEVMYAAWLKKQPRSEVRRKKNIQQSASDPSDRAMRHAPNAMQNTNARAEARNNVSKKIAEQLKEISPKLNAIINSHTTHAAASNSGHYGIVIQLHPENSDDSGTIRSVQLADPYRMGWESGYDATFDPKTSRIDLVIKNDSPAFRALLHGVELYNPHRSEARLRPEDSGEAGAGKARRRVERTSRELVPSHSARGKAATKPEGRSRAEVRAVMSHEEFEAAKLLFAHLSPKSQHIPANHTLVVLGNPFEGYAASVVKAAHDLNSPEIVIVGKGSGEEPERERIRREMIQIDPSLTGKIKGMQSSDESMHTGMNVTAFAQIVKDGAASTDNFVLTQIPTGILLSHRIFEHQWPQNALKFGLTEKSLTFYTTPVDFPFDLKEGELVSDSMRFYLEHAVGQIERLRIWPSNPNPPLVLSPGDLTPEILRAEKLIRNFLSRSEARHLGDLIDPSLLSAEQRQAYDLLVSLGQGHLFQNWSSAGQDIEAKKNFFNDILHYNKTNPHGSLQAYQAAGVALLKNAKTGNDPLKRAKGEPAPGLNLKGIDAAYEALEQAGLREANTLGFVLVAGGVGDRLKNDWSQGLPKIEIPLSLVAGMTHLEKDIRTIDALVQKSNRMKGENRIGQFFIMTSDETYEGTERLLSKLGFKKTGKVYTNPKYKIEIRLGMQEVVPAFQNNSGHFVTESGNPYKLVTKPHGHGDVHSLLFSTETAEDWKAMGIKRSVFFQDTNALVVNAVLPGLGLSLREGYDINYLATARELGEPMGMLMRVTYPDGRIVNRNVEYSYAKQGVVKELAGPDGKSIYPGNMNVFIVNHARYTEMLRQTRGVTAELINPKYSDETKEVFSPARPETNMQDLTESHAAKDFKVGVTSFSDKRFWFAPTKNDDEKGASEIQAGRNPDTMDYTETAWYRFHRKILREVAGVQVQVEPSEPGPLGLYVDENPEWAGAFKDDLPAVEWDRWFAATTEEVKGKFKNVVIQNGSSLSISGENIRFEDVDLKGALIVNVPQGSSLAIKGVTIQNEGHKFVKLSAAELKDPKVPEELRSRHYKVINQDKSLVLDLTGMEPGDYIYDAAGLHKVSRSELRVNENQVKKLAVIGLSDVGIGTAALFARRGLKVTAIDGEETIQYAQIANHEPDLFALIEEAKQNGNLTFRILTDEAIEDAIRENPIIYLDAGNPEGLTNNEYTSRLQALARRIGQRLKRARETGMREFRVFVLRGTVPVGMTEQIQRIIFNESKDSDFGIAYQPDFIQKGRVLQDVNENQVVIGLPQIRYPWEGQKELEDKGDRTWSILKTIFEPIHDGKISMRITSLEAAEASKHSLLDYLALKPSLLLGLAPILRFYGGDFGVASFAIGLDRRVGLAMTNPFIAIGGRLVFFIDFLRQGLDRDYDPQRPSPDEVSARIDELEKIITRPGTLDESLRDGNSLYSLWLSTILAANQQSLEYFQEQISQAFDTVTRRGLNGTTVAVLGVAHKAETDQVTESPMLNLTHWLVANGVREIRVYDPLAQANYKKWMDAERVKNPGSRLETVDFQYFEDPLKAMEGADMAIYGTPLRELNDLPLDEIRKALKPDAILVDGAGIYGATKIQESGKKISLTDVRAAGINLVRFGAPPLGPAFDFIENFPARESYIFPPESPLPILEAKKQRIAIFGSGYVGLVTAAILSRWHQVVVVDLPEQLARIQGLQATPTRLPIYEPGLKESIDKGKASGNLSFTVDGDSAIRKNNLIYIAVGTPQGEKGEVDLSYVLKVERQIGSVIKKMDRDKRRKNPKLVVIKSTVPPNAFPQIEDMLQSDFLLQVGIDYDSGNNPEFLKEGTALKDSMEPDRTVFGFSPGMNKDAFHRAMTTLFETWGPLRRDYPHWVVVTDTTTSTATKLGANAFLAASVSDANLSALRARSMKTFDRWREEILREDPRIPKEAFIRPGCGYGGSCFPKDVRALYYLSNAVIGQAILLIRLADLSNEIFKRLPAWELAEALVGKDRARGTKPLQGKRIGIAGLTFKANTDDVREASAASLVIELALMGADIVLYDPIFDQVSWSDRMIIQEKFTTEIKKKYWGGGPSVAEAYFKNPTGGVLPQIKYAPDLEGVFDDTEGVVIVNEWESLKNLDFRNMIPRMRTEGVKNPILMDARSLYHPKLIHEKGHELSFFSPGIGRPNLGIKYKSQPRSELRLTPSVTPKKTIGAGILSESERRVIREVAVETAGGIYSIRSVARRVEKEKGISREQAAQFAVSFVAEELKGKRRSIAPFSEDEIAKLGEDFVARFFPGNFPDTRFSRKNFHVISEPFNSAAELHPEDPALKLWIRRLAQDLRLVWRLDIRGINAAEAESLLASLIRRAHSWSLPLKSGQIRIEGSEREGFNPETLSQPTRNQTLAFLSPDERYLKAVASREGVEIRLKTRQDESERVAARLLTADALDQKISDPRRREIISTEELAQSQGLSYTALLNAIHSYQEMAHAA